MAIALCRSASGANRGRGLRCLLLAVVVSASCTWTYAAQPPAAAPPAAASPNQAAGRSHLLIVRNLSAETRTISPKDFAGLPRSSVQAKVPHSNQTATYEGVLLNRVLQEAGVQLAASKTDKALSRRLQSAYVLIEAFDGYQVVFSLPEVFSEATAGKLLLADRKDGKPLDAKAAPYQMVETGSDGCDRWIRQVRRILVQPASASPFPLQIATDPEGPTKDGKEGRQGRVYLVGTGPGAPDLITVRAAQVLRAADLVLCYSWMKDELAPFVRPGVTEIASPLLQGGRYFGQELTAYQGPERERAALAREELAKLRDRIKRLLKEGKTVVFADNGDPMIFSPWSWVPEQFAELNPSVVPGLSSFNAGNAALKRSVASSGSVIISSGAELGTRDEKGRLAGTVAFFTHRAKLDELLPKLRERYPADTPVGIVCDASYPAEKVFHGTLGTILEVLGDNKLPHLYLLYVGDGLKQSPCCR